MLLIIDRGGYSVSSEKSQHEQRYVDRPRDLTLDAIEYIATQLEAPVLDLENGTKKIDIIPEGSSIKTPKDISIDSLSVVFEKSHADNNFWVAKIESN